MSQFGRRVSNLIGRAEGFFASRKLQKQQTTKRHVMLIPPTDPGSIGDSAMIGAAIFHLRSLGFDKITLLYGNKWELDSAPDEFLPASKFFFEGHRRQQANLLREMRDYSHVLFLGADVVDGTYNPYSISGRLALLERAALSGRITRILGSSFSKKGDHDTLSRLRALPPATTVCARDPVSCERMANLLDRPVKQVADLAFLVAPLPHHTDAAHTLDWIKVQRQAGRKVVAVNANSIQFSKEPALATPLKVLIETLLKRGCSILLVPHDFRSDMGDLHHLKAATYDLALSDRTQCHTIITHSPGALKAVLGAVDLLVTGRMHAQILAMGMGTPTAALVYQGKFEGLIDLFGLEDEHLLMEPQDALRNSQALTDFAWKVFERREELRTRIAARLPHVVALAQNNFADL